MCLCLLRVVFNHILLMNVRAQTNGTTSVFSVLVSQAGLIRRQFFFLGGGDRERKIA